MKYFHLLILITLFASCNRIDMPIKTNNLLVDSILLAKITKDLSMAYQENSIVLLDSFLNEWYRSVEPIKNSSIKNPLERDLYDIFKLIYRPTNIESISDSTYNSLNLKCSDFVVVQTEVQYFPDFQLYPDSLYIDSLFVVNDFRPEITLQDNKKVLYLTKEYELGIRQFLNIKDDNTEEKFKRSKFLSTRLNLQLSHNANFWYLEDHPLVMSISFENDYKSASVGYIIWYSYWFADLRKEKDIWKITKVECGGVE